MKIENPFTVNMQVNKHNLDVMIDELKKLACEFDFCNTRINKTLLSLYLMRKHLKKIKNPIRDFLGKADWNLLVEK